MQSTIPHPRACISVSLPEICPMATLKCREVRECWGFNIPWTNLKLWDKWGLSTTTYPFNGMIFSAFQTIHQRLPAGLSISSSQYFLCINALFVGSVRYEYYLHFCLTRFHCLAHVYCIHFINKVSIPRSIGEIYADITALISESVVFSLDFSFYFILWIFDSSTDLWVP